MKTSTSWNRRGSAVTANGYFTVLRSTGWFPTFRPPDGFRYLTGKSVTNLAHSVDVVARLTVSNPAANASVPTDPTIALRQIDTGQVGLRALLHTAALALPAAALTFALLWWLMHPGKLL